MTVSQALAMLRDRLTPVSGDFALPEAERVLTFLLGCKRSNLYLNGAETVPETERRKMDRIVQRRSLDEPLAYVLGSTYFYNREFIVGPDVLIPRPETELLIEEIVRRESEAYLRFIDCGTGSGCIAAILTEKRPLWNCIASDRHAGALAVARRNRKSNYSLVCGDRLAWVKSCKCLDFIVCNPPYIPSAEIKTLPPSVRGYEPIAALDGGTDGLAFFRYLATASPALLKQGGRMYCEIGFNQGEGTMAIFNKHGWNSIEVRNDLGGQPRLLFAIRPGEKT
ncbi:MAG: peptide chain release factor N(5)-glutamine methyltransferase [Chitinispirillaceae bacterium]|nr:peptide chain release factor N(5)-glutamine methyltransferase [Chitinispirillaceae bacterium]